jgi:Rrf2 family protein
MARAGVLVSHRGAKGGYRLARPPESITAADIVCAVDGPIALTLCIEHGAGACDVESLCPTRRGWRRINDAVRLAMQSVSLSELAFPSGDAGGLSEWSGRTAEPAEKTVQS